MNTTYPPCTLRHSTPLLLQRYRIRQQQEVKYPRRNDPQCRYQGCSLFNNNTLKETQDIERWKVLIHPEGNAYFCHEVKIERNPDIRIRFWTEGYLSGSEVLQNCNRVRDELVRRLIETLQRDRYFRESVLGAHGFLEAYIGVKENNDGIYYLINHSNRSIFWLDEVDFLDKDLRCGVPIQSRNHLSHILEYYYWIHVRHFPSNEAFKEGEVSEVLSSVLLYGCCDTTGTSESNYPFDSASMKNLFEIFQYIKELQGNGQNININNIHVLSSIAQYMIYFTKQKVYNRFGESNVRVSHLQRFNKVGERKRFIRIRSCVSCILLFAPEMYYRDLQRTYDNLLTMEDWKPFFIGIRNDWQGIVINVNRSSNLFIKTLELTVQYLREL